MENLKKNMNLLGAKVRYKNPEKYFGQNPKDSRWYKRPIGGQAYPYGFMTGDWFTVNRVSGEFFGFEGTSSSAMPYTIKEFSDDNWEWDFSNNKTN